MNILISSVGRQSFLVDCFKDAIKNNGSVIVTDCDNNSIALKHGDKSFTAPKYTDKHYIDWMLNICQEYEIKLIISLNVDEVILLNEFSKNFFELDCLICGSQHDIAKQSNDKYWLSQWQNELNMPSIQTVTFNEIKTKQTIKFPIMAKQRYGKGARGNTILSNQKELDSFISNQNNADYIFQPYYPGTEYGFDIINDLQGNFLRVLARKKIKQENGESQIVKIVDSEFWLNEALTWSKALTHKGTANLDVIFFQNKGYVIDINMRFSGDYVFSHIAGANTPQIIVDCLMAVNIKDSLYHPEINILLERTNYGAQKLSDYR